MLRTPTRSLALSILLGAVSIHAAMAQSKTDALIYRSPEYTVYADRVEQGRYRAQVLSPTSIASNYPVAAESGEEPRTWSLAAPLDAYPTSHSPAPLLDALYTLSLDELDKDLRPDGAFNAGAKWQGVWTRDVSYSILLSLAAIRPDAAKASLLYKVQRDRIVQDTGTGGSWPVSTDRVTWALAAWEIYVVTGDREWLRHSYDIIRNSILDDEQVVLDPATGLAHGESSFMDWREQTYPRWMQPADIYASEDLGTNAVYYRTFQILAQMSQALGTPSQEWADKASRIRDGINRLLWIDDRGYYGEYRYGRLYPSLSPRSDALGESLAILFDIADAGRAARLLRAQPLLPFGIPTVYPQSADQPPYHNDSVWPFVQAYWTLAAAHRADSENVLYGIASITRAAALFLTNKENFVAHSGSPVGTQINSDRQLWSVAGNLALTYRVLYGMHFTPDALELAPVIPRELDGTRTLAGFRYRHATLTITVHGFGTRVARMTIDGAPAARVPATLTGPHTVVVEMDSAPAAASPLRIVANIDAPLTPVASRAGATLNWAAVDGAASYRVLRNGQLLSTTSATKTPLPEGAGLSELQVAALAADGTSSFLSEPVLVGPAPLSIPADAHAPFATLDQQGQTGLTIPVHLSEAGRYVIDFRYANGSGPVNTDNKCAIRTLYVDGSPAGPIVLPQRGTDAWDEWGESSRQAVELTAGSHTLELRLTPADTNMNGATNRARIAAVTLLRLDK